MLCKLFGGYSLNTGMSESDAIRSRDNYINTAKKKLQDHIERINNVLDIPIKLREGQMENKKTIEADSFGICV